jgi:hypothetical protein
MARRKQFSAEEKRAYQAGLRREWAEAKEAAAGNGEVEKIYQHLAKMGVTRLSAVNIQLVLMQAGAAGFDGMPYVDFKTYQEWKRNGFQVERGQSSKVHTITWIGVGGKEEDEDESPSYMFPRLTNLFHSSQVKEIV